MNEYSKYNAKSTSHFMVSNLIKILVNKRCFVKILILIGKIHASEYEAHIVTMEMAERLLEINGPVFIRVGQVRCLNIGVVYHDTLDHEAEKRQEN